MQFRIILRFTDDGLTACSVDFPELMATGRNIDEVEDRMCDAIRQHIERLQVGHPHNELVEPQPSSTELLKRRLA